MYERLRVDRSTTVDRVVDALRSAMFAGELEPGTPLREQPLAEADICRARFVLESAGIRAWFDADESARERVREAMRTFAATAKDGADPEAMTETHLAIHRSLVALTGSERLIATADAITGEARLALARVDALRQDA